MQAAVAECLPRAGKEHSARPQKRRRDEDEAEPTEVRLELALHPAEQPTVERERDGHHVAGNRSGDANARQHRALLGAARLVGAAPAEGVRTVTELVEGAREGAECRFARVPSELGHATRDVELGADRAGNNHRHPLHEPDAGGAVDAFEVERRFGEAVRAGAHVRLLERLVIELGEAASAGRHARGAAVRECIETIQSALPDDGSRRLTARTAVE